MHTSNQYMDAQRFVQNLKENEDLVKQYFMID